MQSVVSETFAATSQSLLQKLLGGQQQQETPTVEPLQPPGQAPELLEERLVSVEEPRRSGGRGGSVLLKEPPGCLAELETPSDLERYSLEALRKLAKAQQIELPKGSSRETVKTLLAERWQDAKTSSS